MLEVELQRVSSCLFHGPRAWPKLHHQKRPFNLSQEVEFLPRISRAASLTSTSCSTAKQSNPTIYSFTYSFILNLKLDYQTLRTQHTTVMQPVLGNDHRDCAFCLWHYKAGISFQHGKGLPMCFPMEQLESER